MYKGRPIIALMPLYDEKRDSYWMLPGYMKALEEQGAIPLMPALNADQAQLDFFLEECDGFVLTGGHDISPRLYSQEPSAQSGLTVPLRDHMDAAPDGIIEAIYMPERRFVWGVQWHPEFSYLVNEGSRKIFAAFLASARTA